MVLKMTIERTLIYYDVPQLFVGIDVAGQRYLCLLFDDEDVYRYVAIRTSTKRLAQLMGGKIDVLEAYANNEASGEYFVVIGDESGLSFCRFEHDIPQEWLPEEGLYLEQEWDNETLMEESLEQGHTVIHLGFSDDENSHSLPLNTLAELGQSYQSLVLNVYKKKNGKGDTLSPKLRVIATSAASFNLHLVANDKLGFFGYSEFSDSLTELDQLLQCSDGDELIEKITPFKGHAVKSYKRFVKLLIDHNVAVKCNWASSPNEHCKRGYQISHSRLTSLYECLSQIEELEKEIVRFEGALEASSRKDGKWALTTENGKQVKGTSVSPELLNDTIIGGRYLLECEEVQEQAVVSNSPKTTYKLIDIKPIAKQNQI